MVSRESVRTLLRALPVFVAIGCVPSAPSRTAELHVPMGHHAERLRVWLPDVARADTSACASACGDLVYSETSYMGCLARCPGAQASLGQSCPARRGSSLCLERIVAVPSPKDPREPLLSDATREGVEHVVLFLLTFTAFALASDACDGYSSDPNCTPQWVR